MQFAARFPWSLGGHDPTIDQEHQAILDAYAPGWDVSEDTEIHAEAWMEAVAVSMIWNVNRRFGNQLIPTRMTDLLEPYERACGLRPKPTAPAKARRNALAAKLRGLAGNLYADIQAAARNAAGSAYVATAVAAAADIFSYLPGINPGPPGFEFSSNRALVSIWLQPGGRSQSGFLAVHRAVFDAIDAIKPVWLRVNIGTAQASLSWTAAPPGSSGVLSMPSWITYECATANTTAQTGPATLNTGFSANDARGFSRDGTAWGLLVEPGATNLITEINLGDGTAGGGTPTITSATDPSGASSQCQIEDDDVSEVERQDLAATAAASSTTHALSAWGRFVSAGTATSATFLCDHDVGSNVPRLTIATTETTWGLFSDVDTTPEGISTTECVAYATSTTVVAQTGTAAWAFPMLEERAYPTSFIDGTRAAGTLTVDPNVVSRDGYLDLTFRAAPLFASTEVSTETVLLYVSSTNKLVWDGTSKRLELTIDNVTIASEALTFSRDQALTVTVQHLSTGVALTVSGATSGNGTTTGEAQDALPAGDIYLLSDDSGADEAFSLQLVRSNRPAAIAIAGQAVAGLTVI